MPGPEPEMPCRHTPSYDRNRDFILDVLRDVLPPRGVVLEVGSGSGQHVAYFARALPQLTWQPSERRAECFSSIEHWTAEGGVRNVRPPLLLDTCDTPWPVERADAVVSINMIHIAPWEACLSLLCGAASVLDPGGLLFLYGPYRVAGRHVGEANAMFDRNLRERDPAWGLRDIDDVAAAADERGLDLVNRIPTPVNNYSLELRRR